MRRDQLQHVIFEIGTRFALTEFYIIGSAAILAALPEPPPGALTATRDVDIIPLTDDQKIADQISFVIGEASDFDLAHGYYAQGVSEATPTFAPRNWKSRAIPIRVAQFTAWCMEPTDLVLSKLGAAREKDIEFAHSASNLHLVTPEGLLERLSLIDCTPTQRTRITERVHALNVPRE